MAKNKKIELSRVNMNLPVSVVNRVKEYAAEIGINTTSAYIVLLNQALDQKDSISSLPFLMEMFNEYKKEQQKAEKDN